jgi:hypothetical protein
MRGWAFSGENAQRKPEIAMKRKALLGKWR